MSALQRMNAEYNTPSFGQSDVNEEYYNSTLKRFEQIRSSSQPSSGGVMLSGGEKRGAALRSALDSNLDRAMTGAAGWYESAEKGRYGSASVAATDSLLGTGFNVLFDTAFALAAPESNQAVVELMDKRIDTSIQQRSLMEGVGAFMESSISKLGEGVEAAGKAGNYMSGAREELSDDILKAHSKGVAEVGLELLPVGLALKGTKAVYKSGEAAVRAARTVAKDARVQKGLYKALDKDLIKDKVTKREFSDLFNPDKKAETMAKIAKREGDDFATDLDEIVMKTTEKTPENAFWKVMQTGGIDGLTDTLDMVKKRNIIKATDDADTAARKQFNVAVAVEAFNGVVYDASTQLLKRGNKVVKAIQESTNAALSKINLEAPSIQDLSLIKNLLGDKVDLKQFREMFSIGGKIDEKFAMKKLTEAAEGYASRTYQATTTALSKGLKNNPQKFIEGFKDILKMSDEDYAKQIIAGGNNASSKLARAIKTSSESVSEYSRGAGKFLSMLQNNPEAHIMLNSLLKGGASMEKAKTAVQRFYVKEMQGRKYNPLSEVGEQKAKQVFGDIWDKAQNGAKIATTHFTRMKKTGGEAFEQSATGQYLKAKASSLRHADDRAEAISTLQSTITEATQTLMRNVQEQSLGAKTAIVEATTDMFTKVTDATKKMIDSPSLDGVKMEDKHWAMGVPEFMEEKLRQGIGGIKGVDSASISEMLEKQLSVLDTHFNGKTIKELFENQYKKFAEKGVIPGKKNKVKKTAQKKRDNVIDVGEKEVLGLPAPRTKGKKVNTKTDDVIYIKPNKAIKDTPVQTAMFAQKDLELPAQIIGKAKKVSKKQKPLTEKQAKKIEKITEEPAPKDGPKKGDTEWMKGELMHYEKNVQANIYMLDHEEALYGSTFLKRHKDSKKPQEAFEKGGDGTTTPSDSGNAAHSLTGFETGGERQQLAIVQSKMVYVLKRLLANQEQFDKALDAGKVITDKIKKLDGTKDKKEISALYEERNANYKNFITPEEDFKLEQSRKKILSGTKGKKLTEQQKEGLNTIKNRRKLVNEYRRNKEQDALHSERHKLKREEAEIKDLIENIKESDDVMKISDTDLLSDDKFYAKELNELYGAKDKNGKLILSKKDVKNKVEDMRTYRSNVRTSAINIKRKVAKLGKDKEGAIPGILKAVESGILSSKTLFESFKYLPKDARKRLLAFAKEEDYLVDNVKESIKFARSAAKKNLSQKEFYKFEQKLSKTIKDAKTSNLASRQAKIDAQRSGEATMNNNSKAPNGNSIPRDGGRVNIITPEELALKKEFYKRKNNQ